MPRSRAVAGRVANVARGSLAYGPWSWCGWTDLSCLVSVTPTRHDQPGWHPSQAAAPVCSRSDALGPGASGQVRVWGGSLALLCPARRVLWTAGSDELAEAREASVVAHAPDHNAI